MARNFYNSNIESDQIKTIEELSKMMNSLNISETDKIIFSGDFNFFFDSKLEAFCGNPTFKKDRFPNFLI